MSIPRTVTAGNDPNREEETLSGEVKSKRGNRVTGTSGKKLNLVEAERRKGCREIGERFAAKPGEAPPSHTRRGLVISP